MEMQRTLTNSWFVVSECINHNSINRFNYFNILGMSADEYVSICLQNGFGSGEIIENVCKEAKLKGFDDISIRRKIYKNIHARIAEQLTTLKRWGVKYEKK